MAASDNLGPQFEPKHRTLSHWGALQEGDKVIGLNGSIATNVKHYGPYQAPNAGRDDRPTTTFDYNHPTDPLWQGKSYRTASERVGPSVYRKNSKGKK